MLQADGNPVAVVQMNNLDLHYSTNSYTVHRRNGKMYVLYPAGLCFIPEEARVQPFSTLSTPSVRTPMFLVQLQMTDRGYTTKSWVYNDVCW